MLIILTFILNAGLNFLLGIVAAAILGPSLYGRFSIGFTIAMVLTTLLFDWLRLSATRFCNQKTRAQDISVRASLDAACAAGWALLALVAALLAVSGADVGLSLPLLLATALVAAANGLFEYCGALLRARFANVAYSVLVIVKNVLAFAGVAIVGLYTRDPAPMLLAAALAAFGATLIVWRRTWDPGNRLANAKAGKVADYLRYGGPIVLANIAYQGVILLNRGDAAAHLDFASAGKLSLAADLTQRLLLAVGAALDILLFQLAVHRMATEGEKAAQRQISGNSLVIAGVLGLLLVGYIADMPAFAALVAPKAFREDFARLALIMAPGVFLFCLGQFCLNPIAQLRGATNTVLAAAFATALIDFALLRFDRPQSLDAYAAIHSASLAAGFVVMLTMTWRWRAYWPAPRDLLKIAGAAVAAGAASWPLRDIEPRLLALTLVALTGFSAYAVLLWLFDPAGLVRPAGARLLSRLRLSRPLRSPTPCPGE